MMKTVSNTRINAPAETVFLWLVDTDRLQQWLPNIIEDEALIETPNKVGSKFRQVYLERDKKMEMFGEITEYVANERLRVDITGEMFDLDVEYILAAPAHEITDLTQKTIIKFKGAMKFIAPVFGFFAKFSSNNPQDESHQKLKKLVEHEHKAG